MGNALINRGVATHGANTVRSSLTLGKATVTVTSYFESSEMLFDLLLSNAKAGIERNKTVVKPVYPPARNPCYNNRGS